MEKEREHMFITVGTTVEMSVELY